MDNIIQKLKHFNKRFPREEIQEAINNKEEITPVLLGILDEIIEDPYIVLDDSEYIMHLYAIFLLAQFREKQAFAKIIELVSLLEEYVEKIFGDVITENLSSILYSTYDGNLKLIQDLIENQDIYFYVRSILLDLYIKLYNDNVITKDDVIKYLKKLIYELPYDEDNDLATDIAFAVSDSHMFELINDVEYLYADFRINESIIGQYDSFIDMIYNYDNDYDNIHFIDDTIQEMEGWDCFEQPREREKERQLNIKRLNKELDLLQRFKSESDKKIKIGRNDPCLCGSGKKYKKCCMDKVEEGKMIFNDKERWLLKYPIEPEVKIEGRIYLSDNYDKESIEIDKLVYLALHHKTISIFVKRDRKAEDKIKIDYLSKAFRMFVIKCEKENITSFIQYDSKYKIHYYSMMWHEELSHLISLQPDVETYKNIFNDVEELLNKF